MLKMRQLKELAVIVPVVLLTGYSCPCQADQLRFERARDWTEWTLPARAVEIMADGTIQAVRASRPINAALNAQRFGGGVRTIGSNAVDGALVLDGDLNSGWSPDWSAPEQDWWIEIDLGRAVSLRQLRLVFAAESDPFELFDLQISNGEQKRTNARVPIAGTLVYRIEERIKQNDQHVISYEPQSKEHSVIRFVRIQVLSSVPGARLVEIEAETFGDNLVLNSIENLGGVDIVIETEGGDSERISVANAIGLMDGDLVTPWRFGRASRGQTDIFGRITVDLGLVYWVDQVRLIGRLVLGRGFDFKFYEVMTSDGSLGPDGTVLWFKHFSGHGSQTNRREGMADHPFPLRPVRLVRIGWKYWDAVCAVETGGGQTATTIACQAQGITEELQVFGTGYPLAVTLRSQILDLQGLKNFTNLEWEGETPPGTRHEIRTRTGNDLNSVITFHNKDGKEITERAWGKLIPSFRGSIDTTLGVGDDWSPWSRIYHTSAQAFQSPVPRRYVQVDVRLVSEDPEAAASLEMLQINFDDPLARDVVAEIAPALTTPAVQQAFSLFVRPRGTVTGFDYLSVEASTQLNFVEARLGGERFDTLAESTDNGFRVALPRRVQSNELLELSFNAEIYLQSTRFDVFLEDRSGDVPVRQRVDAGDATDRAPANTNIVSLPLDPELFVNVDVSSRVLTPNGDGQNDELQVALDVLNLIEERPLRLRIMELSGRVIRSVARGSAAGQQHLVWDARDESGVLVPPGIYILELNLQGDGREESLHRLVTVVY